MGFAGTFLCEQGGPYPTQKCKKISVRNFFWVLGGKWLWTMAYDRAVKISVAALHWNFAISATVRRRKQIKIPVDSKFCVLKGLYRVKICYLYITSSYSKKTGPRKGKIQISRAFSASCATGCAHMPLQSTWLVAFWSDLSYETYTDGLGRTVQKLFQFQN